MRGFARPSSASSLPVDTRLKAVGRLGLLDHAALLHDVGQAVGHPGVGGLAVAAGAAGLLVVGLDALRQIEMRDEAHVGLVDAHAEGDGGDDDDAVLAQEALLVARADAARPGRRDRAGRQSRRREPGGRLLDLRARQAIDDAGVARMRSAMKASSCAHRVAACRRSRSGCSAGRSSRRIAARRRAAAARRSPSRVSASAVAVSAMRGTSGKRSASTDSAMYSGRKSWPHCETQCASSMANSAMLALRQQATRQRGVTSRSGAT